MAARLLLQQLRLDDTASPSLWSLVLAGGDGVRLQALTRALTGAPMPKQYCRLLGGRSLLEATLARIAPFTPPERTLAVVNRDHLDFASEQLTPLSSGNVLVYEALPRWSFSRDFLALIPAEMVTAASEDMGWSDWGTTEAIERTLGSLQLAAPWRIGTGAAHAA